MNTLLRMLIVCTLATTLAPTALAQLTIDWHTIDCGGGTSSSATFTLTGTIGQPDAGSTLAGGAFALDGGFWTPAIPPNQCPCDWNMADGLDSQDFFDFLDGFFQGNADFNGFDGTDSQDYFEFLECFFIGCP